jgi:hypothetical protein
VLHNKRIKKINKLESAAVPGVKETRRRKVNPKTKTIQILTGKRTGEMPGAIPSYS